MVDDTAALLETRADLQHHGLSLISTLGDFGMDCHTAAADSMASGVAPKTAILHVRPQGTAATDLHDHSPIQAGGNKFIPVV